MEYILFKTKFETKKINHCHLKLVNIILGAVFAIYMYIIKSGNNLGSSYAIICKTPNYVNYTK